MARQVLHFTIGPVQGFIADARRTRDLWAGSFILSWLSGKAMEALVNAGAKAGASEVILFPEVNGDPLFEAISKKAGAPYIGSLPNRFKADVSKIDNAGEICKQAVKDAWTALSDAVWNQFIAGEVAKKGKDTKAIWDRQVNSFWDIAWVTDPDTGDSHDWLDRRKNWRSGPSDEPEAGDLCRLMGVYQEISGYEKIGRAERESRKEFYDLLRKSPSVGSLNLGDSEYLCAIALIKRLFPVLDNIEAVIGWKPGGTQVNVKNWPSVSYLAAVPWLKKLAAGEPETTSGYIKALEAAKLRAYMGETETRLFNLPRDTFFKLDGQLLHLDGISQFTSVSERRAVEDLSKALRDVNKSIKTSPSEFYAILLMDGDRIGEKVATEEAVVKGGLDKFAKSVVDYFSPENNGNAANGVLIYAGGDDVLALLPVDSAIEAAQELRKRYNDAFGAKGSQYTLSGAIVFSQYKIPFRTALKQAHTYLDAVAKEKNGRDSLAIAVMKPGGVAADWVSTWGMSVETMKTLSSDLEKYSTSFFYNVRQRYLPLFTDASGEQSTGAVDEMMPSLLAMEYKRQQGPGGKSPDELREAIQPILQIGFPEVRTADGHKQKSKIFSFDAPLVVRFINKETKGTGDAA
jgi:CRISPR-associated protein Cmr2